MRLLKCGVGISGELQARSVGQYAERGIDTDSGASAKQGSNVKVVVPLNKGCGATSDNCNSSSHAVRPSVPSAMKAHINATVMRKDVASLEADRRSGANESRTSQHFLAANGDSPSLHTYTPVAEQDGRIQLLECMLYQQVGLRPDKCVRCRMNY